MFKLGMFKSNSVGEICSYFANPGVQTYVVTLKDAGMHCVPSVFFSCFFVLLHSRYHRNKKIIVVLN